MAGLLNIRQRGIWRTIQHVLNMRGLLCRDCIIIKGAFPVSESIEVSTVLTIQQKKSLVILSSGQCRRCRCENEIYRLPIAETEPTPKGKPWFCEENIQKIIICHLQSNNYSIEAVDHTTSVIQGVCIKFENDLKGKFHLFVQGYYGKSFIPRTSRLFKEAIFDLIVYMKKYREIQLAIGLPAFNIYKDELRRINWIRDFLPFKVFWVTEKGEVLEG